jgi:hypothetical protein
VERGHLERDADAVLADARDELLELGIGQRRQDRVGDETDALVVVLLGGHHVFPAGVEGFSPRPPGVVRSLLRRWMNG